MVIVWENKAKQQLKKAYEYILQDSYQNAIKVRKDIVDAVISLLKLPERHPLDKYKNDNDGTWRAFEIHHYRISYRVFNEQIRIVRLRHTKMSPLTYKLAKLNKSSRSIRIIRFTKFFWRAALFLPENSVEV